MQIPWNILGVHAANAIEGMFNGFDELVNDTIPDIADDIDQFVEDTGDWFEETG